MRQINKVLMVLMMSVLMSACAAYGEKNADTSASDLTLCEEPRPQICTREYRPVCATLNDGNTKTSATGCTACADSQVVGYKMGVCEK